MKPTAKTCSVCKRVLGIDEFYCNSASKDGHAPLCKECSSVRGKAYYAANKEKMDAQHRRYIEATPDKTAARRKKYRRANRKEMSAKRRERYTPNQEKSADANGRRRARELGVASELLPDHYGMGLYESQGGLCYYCADDLRATGYHIDHTIPLSQGGTHVLSNLVLACPSCNLSKSKKTEEEYAECVKSTIAWRLKNFKGASAVDLTLARCFALIVHYNDDGNEMRAY